MIEHIPDENLIHLLFEVYRVIRKNAIIRISCPDADLVFNAYKNKKFDFFYLNNEVSLVGDTVERRLVNFFASYKKGNYSGGLIIDKNEVNEKINLLSKSDFIKCCKTKIPHDAEYTAHINGYYFEKLRNILAEIGFKNIVKSNFRESNDLELRGKEFDNRPRHLLFVECYK
ncbi:hypothetical protein [Clostridium tyrobutyricum]|uniref:hypothetical protein n=1 Tax=Clostridium tyrobutyricum TaxID=1519 RepID=UPI001C38161F|nr:hypothetical protein [Clostridium tyrobutyricum]MBV4428315.1 hypothetical protein [Clostridium tyrobutyricum]MBV4443305.1 hypothetical protein [Clostridium tyrobutyricum]